MRFSTTTFAAAADVVLALVLLGALVTDLRTRRIPDALTFPAMALGLLLSLGRGGLGETWTTPGLKGAAVGLAAGWGVFALLVLLGGMGGGDAKLMGAVGALVGFPQVLGAVVFIALAGGVLGLVAVAARSSPGRRACLRLGMRGAAQPGFGRTVPYAAAIAAGTVGFRWWVETGAV